MGLLTLLIGCDKTAPAPDLAATKKMVILAAVYPLADLARQVGGQHVDARWLLESGQHPADLRDSPELRRQAGAARIVLTSGPWDSWASSDLTPEARTLRIIEPQRTPSAGERDGAAVANPAAYLWLDPQIALDMVETLRERLGVADPSHSRQFQENAAACRAELQTLDAQWRTTLAPLANRNILIVRPIWSAMLRRYQLEPIAPVQNPETQLTASDYKALAAAAKTHNLTTLYVDISTPLPVRQQITERTSLRVLPLDSTGTSAPSGNSTYVKLMRYNLGQLMKE